MIKIDKTKETSELIKALASKNPETSFKAQMAIAAQMSAVIQEVIKLAPTISNLFEDVEYNEGENPSIPLALFRPDETSEFFTVWSQREAGGLATSMVTPPSNDLKLDTYTLDGAMSFFKKYATGGRVEVIQKAFERLANEILAKQEVNSSVVVLQALAKAATAFTVGGVPQGHVIRSANAGAIVLEDFLSLQTLAKRVNSAWNKGTPLNKSQGITDLLVSPEMVQKLKGMAYNPINTRGTKTDIPGTEAFRNALYDAAGDLSFYNVNIIEVNELGINYRNNALFATQAGATTYTGGGVTAAFNPAAEQILVGIDRSKTSLVRPVAVDSETNSSLTVLPDDQFVGRAGKVGWYAQLEEGRTVLDDRALLGLIV